MFPTYDLAIRAAERRAQRRVFLQGIHIDRGSWTDRLLIEPAPAEVREPVRA